MFFKLQATFQQSFIQLSKYYLNQKKIQQKVQRPQKFCQDLQDFIKICWDLQDFVKFVSQDLRGFRATQKKDTKNQASKNQPGFARIWSNPEKRYKKSGFKKNRRICRIYKIHQPGFARISSNTIFICQTLAMIS